MLPWHLAWGEALYGPQGFYRTSAPAQHFRTSVHASALLAQALARLAGAVGLGRVVDVGCGRGELLRSLADVDPALELVGVDVVERPRALPASARWVVSPGGAELPELDLSQSLVVANELLDNVPCPVLELDLRGQLRVVEVSPTGSQRLGGQPAAEELAWVRRWWPVEGALPGTRVEVGLPRDRVWAALVAQAPGSVLVAIDYSHTAELRPLGGTLIGYRSGRPVAPVPDGSCDVTADVALDAVAAAPASVAESVLTTQREALLALDVEGRRPPLELASRDPSGYLIALQRAGEAGELLERDALGGFGWLVQSRGPRLPTALRLLNPRRQPATGSEA